MENKTNIQEEKVENSADSSLAFQKQAHKKTPTRIVFLSLKAAFPHTIPIMAGFWFLGLTYGIYMNSSGFSFLYPMFMSMIIFGGSLEFIVVNLLLGSFNPLQAFTMSLVIQARHIFYGITMLDKYKGTSWKKPYLIFGMCDESFSINCSAEIPDYADKGWFMFWVTVLNQFYWVSGSTIGGLVGSFITFNTKGLDFCMTAMFVVIFLDQWLKEKKHWTAIIGLASSILSLVLLGADDFMIPTMVLILLALTICKKPIEKAGGFIES